MATMTIYHVYEKQPMYKKDLDGYPDLALYTVDHFYSYEDMEAVYLDKFLNGTHNFYITMEQA